MQTIAESTTLIDLEYLDEPGHFATCLLETGDGLALVDPGPTTTLGRLGSGLREAGASLADLRVLLVTHIHLDHSGGAGCLARDNPRLRIYVHERGAPHLADPAKLLRSATMLYGDQMERLWGEVAPVPREAIHPLQGGERIRLGARSLEVAYTPGHAWHHVSYLDERTGVAFTGDVLGEQAPGSVEPIPVTPPPDADVEAMTESGRRILAWGPTRLFVTHFGLVEDPATYGPIHEERLADWSLRVRDSLAEPGTDEERAARFTARVVSELGRRIPAEATSYLREDVHTRNWLGLARYWRKREPATG